jgi:hypothetical protein
MPIEYLQIVSVSVSSQDHAKEFYVNDLGWDLLSDEAYELDGGQEQRWLEVRPAGGQTAITLVLESSILKAGSAKGIPRGWQNLRLPASQHAVAAVPRLNPPCPNTIFGGPAACQDAVTITNVRGDSAAQALEQAARIRFNAMHHVIRAVAVLGHRAMTLGRCPAYMTEWHVTSVKQPSTLEERIVVRTGVANANSNLESVFIRFADTSDARPQASIKEIVSSIRCK